MHSVGLSCSDIVRTGFVSAFLFLRFCIHLVRIENLLILWDLVDTEYEEIYVMTLIGGIKSPSHSKLFSFNKSGYYIEFLYYVLGIALNFYWCFAFA